MNTFRHYALLFILAVIIIDGCIEDVKPSEKNISSRKKDSIPIISSTKIDSSANKQITSSKNEKVSDATKKQLHNPPLTLILSELASKQSMLVLRLYKEHHKFMDRNSFHREYRILSKGQLDTLLLENIEFGEYALVVYQDRNNNDRIDKNLLGLPTESYALSNNYRPKLRLPTYHDCKFSYTEANHTLFLKLDK